MRVLQVLSSPANPHLATTRAVCPANQSIQGFPLSQMTSPQSSPPKGGLLAE